MPASRSRIMRGCLFAVFTFAFLPGVANAQDILQEWPTVKAPPAPAIKPVTVDPAKTALFVMDFNRRTCTAHQRARCAAALPALKTLIDRMRQKGTLLVYTFSPNMTRGDLMEELGPQKDERVYQAGIDKFYGNDLEAALRARGITTIVTTGTSANGAVLFAALNAALRGFKVVVPIDTMPADTAYQEQFTIWEIANGPQIREHAVLTRSDLIGF